MRLSRLIYPNEYLSGKNPADIEIDSIVYDAKKVTPGCLFICLRGVHFDTHNLIAAVLSRGAAAILAEQGADFEAPPDAPVFYVKSCRRALSYAWSRYCNNPAEHLTVIGITGTNGKTSTAYMLNTVLRKSGLCTALIGTLGLDLNGETVRADGDARYNTMTTPDPDILYPFLERALMAGVTHVVMEVSSHALSLEKVAPIEFEEALFTNLAPEHLDFHCTIEDYAAAKEKLFRHCRHATLNCDDACAAAIAARAACPVTRCGIVWQGDANATQIERSEENTYSYFYRFGEIRQLVSLGVGGNFQVYNSLLAMTSAIHLGIPAGAACAALCEISSIPGRMQLITDCEDDIHVYIDFAHTEAALRTLLKTVKATARKRVILVFGCGGERDATKRAPMGKCAMELADYTVVTSDNSRGEDTAAIIKEILRGHTDPTRRKVIVDREKAIEYAILTAEAEDTVILAGKGHEAYEIKRDGLHPFDEKEIAIRALRERKNGHNKYGEGNLRNEN